MLMLTQWDGQASVDGITDQYHSPSLTPDQNVVGAPLQHFNHLLPAAPQNLRAENPADPSWLGAPIVPKPPDPAVGGQIGVTDQLGWSTGLRISRAFRQRFTGRTLVVPNMGPNPKQGRVGAKPASQQKLLNGTRALSTDYTPTTGDVSNDFLAGRTYSPAQREILGIK